MAKKQGIKITKDLLAKALTWHCPYYTRDGVSSYCLQGDRRTNCCGTAMLCTQVTDIFQTMAKIQNGEIEVF
jgi:hypothetical protein